MYGEAKKGKWKFKYLAYGAECGMQVRGEAIGWFNYGSSYVSLFTDTRGEG